MIINLTKSILHILDANSGVSVYSQKELDLDDALIQSYICEHIDKVCDDAGMRKGEFHESSGFKYKLLQYKNNEISFTEFSEYIAEKLYELIGASDKINSFDLIISDCVMGEHQTIAILKCDSKPCFIHQVNQADGIVKNEIVNQFTIMPSATQRFNDYAFISVEDLSIKYKPKKINVDGEKTDMFADGLFECDFDYSTKESFNTMTRLAKKVTQEFAGNEIDTEAKIKQYVKDTAIATEKIAVDEVADIVFTASPSAKEEFSEKAKKAEIPENIPMNTYVTKRVNKNIKIATDTGVEISFPAEFYQDEENLAIVKNDDGTISIQINNINQIINK